MSRITIASILILSALLSPSLSGDAQQRIRKEYTEETAPPEVKFQIFLSAVIASGNQPLLNFSLIRMGIAKSDIDSVVAYFFDIKDRISVEIKNEKLRFFCPHHQPRPTGPTLHSIFNELDEIKIAVHAKYLAIAAADMHIRGYDNFREMLNLQGGSFLIEYFDHLITMSEEPDRANIHAEAYCNEMDDRSTQ